MKESVDIVDEVLANLITAISSIPAQRDEIEYAVDLLNSDKIFTMGVGKSGLVAQKVAATFSTTGTPAFFLHPTEAAHGNLGQISKGDTILIFSNSGETKEIVCLLDTMIAMGIKIVAITGNQLSMISSNARVSISLGSETRDPILPVPTVTAASMMILGDALALAVASKRGFQKKDMLALHPGGQLGKHEHT